MAWPARLAGSAVACGVRTERQQLAAVSRATATHALAVSWPSPGRPAPGLSGHCHTHLDSGCRPIGLPRASRLTPPCPRAVGHPSDAHPRLALCRQVKPRDKYDVRLPLWVNVYLSMHFVLVVLGFQELALRYMVS